MFLIIFNAYIVWYIETGVVCGTIENEIKHLPCVAILKAFCVFPVMSGLLEIILEND